MVASSDWNSLPEQQESISLSEGQLKSIGNFLKSIKDWASKKLKYLDRVFEVQKPSKETPSIRITLVDGESLPYIKNLSFHHKQTYSPSGELLWQAVDSVVDIEHENPASAPSPQPGLKLLIKQDFNNAWKVPGKHLVEWLDETGKVSYTRTQGLSDAGNIYFELLNLDNMNTCVHGQHHKRAVTRREYLDLLRHEVDDFGIDYLLAKEDSALFRLLPLTREAWDSLHNRVLPNDRPLTPRAFCLEAKDFPLLANDDTSKRKILEHFELFTHSLGLKLDFESGDLMKENTEHWNQLVGMSRTKTNVIVIAKVLASMRSFGFDSFVTKFIDFFKAELTRDTNEADFKAFNEEAKSLYREIIPELA